jgi:hypothetical protein
MNFHYSASNDNLVMGSARFFVERSQLELRVRLDTPTLNDPVVRELLQESDLFTRSFCGGGFGVISPLDFFQVLSLFAEMVSHLLLIFSLTKHSANLAALLFSLLSVTLPFLLPFLGLDHSAGADPLYGGSVANASHQQERMRSLAYSDVHRQEIAIFGLGEWIVRSWSTAWKSVFQSEQAHSNSGLSFLLDTNFSDLVGVVQNVSTSRMQWCF